MGAGAIHTLPPRHVPPQRWIQGSVVAQLKVPQLTKVIVQPMVRDDAMRILAHLEGVGAHALSDATLRARCFPNTGFPACFNTGRSLAQHGTLFAIACLLHATSKGKFGSIRSGITASKHRRVGAVIGAASEFLVHAYTRRPWNSRLIVSLPEQLPGMSPGDQDIILMRLANELEEGVGANLRYCAKG